MKLTEFAERFRVKTKVDSCGEQIIPGKPYKTRRPEDRNQIFDYGDDEHFGVSLLLTTARQWGNAAKRLLAVGMTVLQEGDTEGTLLFDPANASQVRAAPKEAGIKRRRVLSLDDRLARAAHLKRARACQAEGFRASKTTRMPEVTV
ncbi:MAG TPA: hypothetical protein VKB49_24240 [Candidatus Sulfotelmatobacter sp.]|nr:hypothetical protein [Candidatus Sulfotelmatobacter sp.]